MVRSLRQLKLISPSNNLIDKAKLLIGIDLPEIKEKVEKEIM